MADLNQKMMYQIYDESNEVTSIKQHYSLWTYLSLSRLETSASIIICAVCGVAISTVPFIDLKYIS